MDSKVNTLNACTVRMVSGLAFRSQRSVRVVLMSTSRLSSPWTHTYQRCVHPMTSSPHPITTSLHNSQILCTLFYTATRETSKTSQGCQKVMCVFGYIYVLYVCVCLLACMCVCIYVFMLVLMCVCVVLVIYIVGVCI